jgi:UDP-GlcNAc:undecaprenyl-phosphate GlcNAc-1-phosphate transferase
MAIITTIGTGVIFYKSGDVQLLPLTWAMIGALAGFLIFNARIFVRRAWVFMGDAGSMWLGLVLGWFMVQVTVGKTGAEPAIVLWLFGIPLLDTLCVIIRRLKRKASPFAPDRTHIHHVFEHNGLSVKQTVLLLTLIQAVLVCIGVIFYLTQAPAALIFGSFVALMLVYYFLIQRYKGPQSGGPGVVIAEEHK